MKPLAVAVACFLLAGCGGDDTGSGEADQSSAITEVLLDTAPAVAELQALFEEAESTGSVATLDECPLGRMHRSLDDLWVDSDDVVTAPGLGGIRSVSVYAFAPDFSAMVSCDRYADDESDVAGGIGAFAMLAPPSIRAFVESFAVVDEADPPEISVDEAGRSQGGQFYRVCVRYPDDEVSNYCEVDWLNGDLLLGTYVAGPNATDADLGAVEAVFAAELPRYIETLGEP